MELKRGNVLLKARDDEKLLIVPYGIETYLTDTIIRPYYLLIVPYGIETL